jgi:hypothetical protein
MGSHARYPTSKKYGLREVKPKGLLKQQKRVMRQRIARAENRAYYQRGNEWKIGNTTLNAMIMRRRID